MCAQWTCNSGYTKCADNLECINETFICDERIDCKDDSDELCSCLSTDEKSISRRCPDDFNVCIPVRQYCDGIAQCPHAGDETQSNCTCEDWSLISCKNANNRYSMNCLNQNWAPQEAENKSDFECHAFMHMMDSQHGQGKILKESQGMVYLLLSLAPVPLPDKK